MKESDLQINCVKWFSYQHPELKGVLFAVPNGGFRNAREAQRMKREGVVSGVADLILLKPNNKYNALCLELKVGRNKQTENQLNWQMTLEKQGSKYVVIRSFDSFKKTIENYLNETS